MTSHRIDSELEAKLLVEDDGVLDALAGLERLGPYTLHARPLQQLYSVYFDTKDLALTRHGLALRVRRHGTAWEATTKWAGSITGVIHERPELNVPLSGPPDKTFRPPAELHVHLAAVRAGRALVPALVSEITRRPIDVLDATGTRVAEIALDRVRLHSPRRNDRRSDSYAEVEIERKGGTSADVNKITALLRRGRQLRPSPDTKLGRGMRLLYGAVEIGAPKAAHLSAADSIATALPKLAAPHVARLVDCDPRTRLGKDPEALHGMRVACRRLRAVVRLLAQTTASRQARRLRDELRWLGQTLGAVRDVDVQLQRLDQICCELPNRARTACQPFVDSIGEHRQQAREAMLVALDSPRYFRLLRDLEALVCQGIDDHTGLAIGTVAAMAIRKAYKKLRRRAKDVGRAPSAADLHAVRIRAKHVRYASELVRSLMGKPGHDFIQQLMALQDPLGTHNDAVVATQFIRRYLNELPPACGAASVRVLMKLIRSEDEHAERARAEFHRAWKQFARPRHRAALDSMLTQLRDGVTINT